MVTLASAPPMLTSKFKPSFSPQQKPLFPNRRRFGKKNQSIVPVARLFGPAIFEASKLKVLFLGIDENKHPGNLPRTYTLARLFGPAIFEASKLKVLFLGIDENKHPGNLPRTYTLTHSDITSKLTLAISQTINNSQLQGWYNRLQRDEVVAQWKKVKGKMCLHVHCHISGGHFLLDMLARFRYFIFRKELPVVLKAFVHGDENLFNNYPELQEALVWVFFHSKIPEFNKVECWGPLKEASAPSSGSHEGLTVEPPPKACEEDCECCFPPLKLSPIRWSQEDPNQSYEPIDGVGTQHNL